jgi:carboxymethylenebutenolidase
VSEGLRAAAIALYDRFTHEGLDRRAFMAELTKLAGSAAAANALLLAIAADPAAAALTAEGDERLVVRRGSLELKGTKLNGYVAAPKGSRGKLASVIVVHENRGLNRHIEDVARRIALAGYFAVAPDFLSGNGGTPADEDAARAAIGKLDLGAVVSEAVALAGQLRRRKDGNGKVGAIGFCWGGAFVNRLAVAAGPKLDAAVSYYGPAPAPAEAARVHAPILAHLAGNDTRVNAGAAPWIEALKAAGKDVTAYTYPGVEHAFNNDTSAERYNEAAAKLAWERTLAFFKSHLQAPVRRS